MNKNFPHFQTCYHATNLSSYLDPRQDSPSKSKRAYLPRTDGNIVKKKLLPFRTERKKFTRRERKEKRTLLYNKKKSMLLSYSTRTVFHGGGKKKTRSDDSSRDFHGEPTGCSQKETSHNPFVPSKVLSNLSLAKENDDSRTTRLVYAPSRLIAEFLQIRNGYGYPLCR